MDLENRIQSLKEELSFVSEVHKQELNVSVQRSRVVAEEVDGRLHAEYDSKLCEALAKMREKMEEQLQCVRHMMTLRESWKRCANCRLATLMCQTELRQN